MADFVYCRSCEVRIVRLPDEASTTSLGPCPYCGQIDWKGVASLVGRTGGTSGVTGQASIYEEPDAMEARGSVGPVSEQESDIRFKSRVQESFNCAQVAA